MKKQIIVGIALAMGMLSAGAVSASAAASCCDGGKCTDKRAIEQFSRETAGTTGELKAKEVELREQYGYEGIDNHKTAQIEAEIKELKGKVRLVAEKYSIQTCCLGY